RLLSAQRRHAVGDRDAIDDVTDEEAVHAAEQTELCRGVDILFGEYKQIDCTDRRKREGNGYPAPRGQQKSYPEHQVRQKFSADAPARRIPGDSVMKTEGVQKQDIREERIRRVVRIAGDFYIGSHATRHELNERRPQDEHEKCEMQRPEPAEASYHESNQILPRRQFPCVGVRNDETAQHKKEVDE